MSEGGFTRDHFGNWLGYRLLPPTTPGELPRTEMTIAEKHLSGAGVAHGGAVYSLVDFALGAAMFATFTDRATRCSTVELHMNYVRPVPLGTTLCVAPRLVHQGRSLARLEGKVLNDAGECVAFATGTFNIYTKVKTGV